MSATIAELLDRAEQLAEMAEEEALSDDPAMLINAAGKGWNAANLSMAAVIDHFTHHRPRGTEQRQKALRDLAHRHRGKMSDFRGVVGDAYSNLHLRAEEQAEYSAKVLRRTVRDVRAELVPLAKQLCGYTG